jgi:hypothetical protein
MTKSPNWQSKADLGWPLLEYVGKNQSELIFKGRATKRVYRAGDNRFHKLIRVHPDDLSQLQGLTCFRLKVESEPQQIKAPKPQSPPVVKPMEPVKVMEPPIEPTKPIESMEPIEPPVEIELEPNKGNGELDIGSLSVRVLRAMDLAGQDLGVLMQDEREGRNRRTIMAHLRLEQRKRVAVSDLGQGA